MALGCLYFLPTLIAVCRGHRRMRAILFNLTLSWTGLGWLLALIWATRPAQAPRRSR
jgi:hypothetical protein